MSGLHLPSRAPDSREARQSTEMRSTHAHVRARDVVCRVSCACALTLAAVLKIHSLLTNESPSAFIFKSRRFEMLLVGYEMFIALWFTLGCRSTLCRQVSLATFSAFACYSMFYSIAGVPICGCFGNMHVSPWSTLILDSGLLILVWRWSPGLKSADLSAQFAPNRWIRRGFITLLAVSLASVAVIAYSVKQRRVPNMANAESIADGSFVLLEPAEWTGKRFPLTNYIDIGRMLQSGSWLVVFYRHDCPECRRSFPKYEQLGEAATKDTLAPRVALIEVPPYGTSEAVHIRYCTLGKLSDSKTWIVTTPAETKIVNGRVVRVH